MVQVAGVIALVILLFAFSFRRPWTGLVVLLALVPFNGVVLAVVAPILGLDADARTFLGAWHDGLALGIVGAAGTALIRDRPRLDRTVLVLVAAILAFGLVGIAISPFRLTAVYAYRTLYEPIVLFAAVLLLASALGLPAVVRRRVALAIVWSAVAATAFGVWQVYVGGVGFLNAYYRTSDGRLPAAFFSSMISQPRALATFSSPNEYGAYLVLAVALTAVGGVFVLRRRTRAWILVVLASGLLLTFSRSAWIGAAFALVAVAALTAARLGAPRAWLARLDARPLARDLAPPAIALVLVVGTILASSGGVGFLAATLQGRDPSSASRVDAITNAIQHLINPSPAPAASPGSTPGGQPAEVRPQVSVLGMGLGTAGPKSARFGEIGALAIVSSETWYVNYLLQAGIAGSLILAALIVVLAVRLWRRRREPWAIAAMAGGVGLAVGALAIPVVDEPSVAIPLWAMFALALAASPMRKVGQPSP